ncbi:MAG: hypothetical protein WC949_04900 [Candidatus Paceibacterota bacterium]
MKGNEVKKYNTNSPALDILADKVIEPEKRLAKLKAKPAMYKTAKNTAAVDTIFQNLFIPFKRTFSKCFFASLERKTEKQIL